MNLLNSHVLVLNQSFQPMSITNVRKAFILIFLGKAEIVEKDGQYIHSISAQFPVPSIVRLTRFIHVPKKRVMLTRKNILKRDNHQCQYCGKRNVALTIDHVIPRVRQGADTWENLVCACVKCNNKKGNHALDEVGFKLLKKPQKPNHIFFIRYAAGVIDQRWKPYLYMN